MSERSYASVVVAAIVCCLLGGGNALGDVSVTGDVTFYFTSLYDQNGEFTGYRYDGYVVNIPLTCNIPIVEPIGLRTYQLGTPGLPWSHASNWDNPLLALANTGVVLSALINDGRGHVSLKENWEMVDTLLNSGPTERDVSVPGLKVEVGVSGVPPVELGVGFTMKWNVHLDPGADIVMDQRVVLERLLVQQGAHVTGNNTFVTRTDLINWGLFDNLMGTVERDFVNRGRLIEGGGAIVTGPLNIQGNLDNTGEIRILGGSLNLSRVTTNHGVIVLNGGSLQHATTFGNFGTVDWRNGQISGTGAFENHGLVNMLGDSSKGITGDLRNAGTITHTGKGDLSFSGGQLNNLSSGLYDFQNDARFVGGYPDGGQVNNAGTFRKSDGDGEAMIGYRVGFHNTGTVEVLSGTLAFGGGGSSEDATIHLESGGRARFSNQYDYGYTGNSSNVNLYRETAITGNGTVEIDGADLVVPSGQTATLRGSGDTHLDIKGGFYDGRLMADTGSTLTLDMSGNSSVRLMSGVVGGAGNVINTGNFEWSGGYITGNLANVSPNFEIMGDSAKSIAQTGDLRNSGTIAHTGTGNLLFSSEAELNNLTGGVYDLQSDADLWGQYPSGGQVNNAGTFRKSGGTGESVVGPRMTFQNSGTVEALSGTLTFSGGFTQTAGSTRLNGGSISSTTPLSILGGTIEGTGDILARVLNEGGTVSPGFSPGMLTINGDYTQGPDATLLLELAGLLPGQFDVFNVTGTATLDGHLQISFLDGFRPEFGDTFQMFTYGSRIGEFDSIFFTGLSGFEFTPIYGLDGLTLRTDSVQAVPLPGSAWLGATGILLSLYCMHRHDHSELPS